MKKLKAKKMDAVEKQAGVFRLKQGVQSARAKHADDLEMLAKGNLKAEDLVPVMVRLMQRVAALEE